MDSNKMKPAVPGFTDTLSKKEKKMQEEKMKTITNLSDNVVTTLFYHMRGVFKCFTYLVCAYKQKTEEVDIPCKKMN